MKQERNQGGNVKFSAMRDGVHLRASDMERWLNFQQVFLKRSCVKGPCKYDVPIIFGFLNPAPPSLSAFHATYQYCPAAKFGNS